MSNVTKLSPGAQRDNEEFYAKVAALAENATEEDQSRLEAILNAGPVSIQEIDAAVAAMIFHFHNKHNRDFSLNKARSYADAMRRGEWRLVHQGIAFYEDDRLADGQHRMASVVLCELPQKFTVMHDFDPDAIEAIDVGKRRTAGDALQLKGHADGKLRASVATTVMQYEHRRRYAHGFTPSIYEVETWTDRYSAEMAQAILISDTRHSDPPLGKAETASAALAMLVGGYSFDFTQDLLDSINGGGLGKGEGSPPFVLFMVLNKAKSSANPKGKMTKEEKLAHIFKGASLYLQGLNAARIDWKPGKEQMPAPMPPAQKRPAA